MSKKCIIITGGTFSELPKIKEGDFVIACDKGYEYAVQEGIRPDLLLGDFDSCTIKPDPDIPIEKYASNKDDTDTMIAMRYAAANHYEQIELACALGGRLDHAYANMQAGIFAAEHGAQVRISGVDTQIYIFRNSSLRIAKQPDYSVSVFCATDKCENVTIKGLQYTLENAELTNSFPIGCSNEWLDDAAEISVGKGTLCVILSKK